MIQFTVWQGNNEVHVITGPVSCTEVALVVDDKLVIHNAYGRVGNVEVERNKFVFYWGPIRTRFESGANNIVDAVVDWVKTNNNVIVAR
jgi:hypothetical protein